jgi:predicted aminopeptidase
VGILRDEAFARTYSAAILEPWLDRTQRKGHLHGRLFERRPHRYLALTLLGLCSCFHAHYLAQATRGQLEILDKRRPIPSVIADPRTSETVRGLLAEVEPVKRFATAHGLSATNNYSRYSDLKREAAVWVVTASQPLAFQTKTFWFPIVGDVPYLGWFRHRDAARFAAALQKEGLDVSLRPASAYSTLGFFEDPILSTMLSTADELPDLVNTILHESLHATFYVPGRTDLSESVASFVGDELTLDYLDVRFGPGSKERARYEADVARGNVRRERMLQTKAALKTLYASRATDEEKRVQKGQLLGALRRALGTKRVINNASLAELASYGSGQQQLRTLLVSLGRDWPRFLAALHAWAKQPAPSFATLL